jgi:hypothetical protein
MIIICPTTFFVLNSVAVGALDPNDLTCLEGDFIPIEQVGKSLHYLCRFENIGKYSAQNIVISMIWTLNILTLVQ